MASPCKVLIKNGAFSPCYFLTCGSASSLGCSSNQLQEAPGEREGWCNNGRVCVCVRACGWWVGWEAYARSMKINCTILLPTAVGHVLIIVSLPHSYDPSFISSSSPFHTLAHTLTLSFSPSLSHSNFLIFLAGPLPLSFTLSLARQCTRTSPTHASAHHSQVSSSLKTFVM